MKCVILQPSYIPWRGYFHQIHKADVFIFYDDVQYDRRGWRNRNRIKTPAGAQWLSIPVLSKGSRTDGIPINEIEIDKTRIWREKHFKTLQQSYRKAPFFADYETLLASFYERNDAFLADFTINLTVALSKELGIEKTVFRRSSDFRAQGKKTDRLLSLLQAVGATHYITGATAKDYLEEEKFAESGIALEYMIYDYPEYAQLYPPFDGQISILDLLFMTGPEAGQFIWGTKA
ncbi:MAG: WbqC family protein [Acidobacteriota bacterium]|nr:WbqC family protein [Acidobacteriota bacterium]